jgi:hypothetical protein
MKYWLRLQEVESTTPFGGSFELGEENYRGTGNVEHGGYMEELKE